MSYLKVPVLPPTSEYAKIIVQYQQAPPVEVVRIAEALGLRVWEFSDLPPTVSGKIFKDAKNGGASGFSIGVNATESFTRKRFTVAHELAHFILHRNRITNELVDDTMYRSPLVSSAEEVEANKVAADILMPYHLIQRLMGAGMTNVDQLASAFQVSGTAMRVRLNIPVV